MEDCRGPGARQIRLWCAFYGEIEDRRLLEEYRRLLSGSERSQEQRFHFEDDRRRYLVTRALVRTVLSRQVDHCIAPEEWRFARNESGRPEIGNEHPAARGLSFNISHTKGLVILAVAADRAVGVDVEAVRERESSLDIAARYFAPAEAAALAALPAGQQQRRFFEYWTLKESYIKARGLGLALPLNRFSFEFPQNESIALTIDPGEPDTADRWRFWQLRLREDFLVAVCAEGAQAEFLSLGLTETIPLACERALEVRPFRRSSGAQ